MEDRRIEATSLPVSALFPSEAQVTSVESVKHLQGEIFHH
jgi:hypothetical protein